MAFMLDMVAAPFIGNSGSRRKKPYAGYFFETLKNLQNTCSILFNYCELMNKMELYEKYLDTEIDVTNFEWTVVNINKNKTHEYISDISENCGPFVSKTTIRDLLAIKGKKL